MTGQKVKNSLVRYATVKLCSNEMTGGGELIEVFGVYPIQIWKGSPPIVTLYGVKDSGKRLLAPVVRESESLFPAVAVMDVFDGVVVTVRGEKVFSAREESEDTVEVDFLDLRPLGLDIHGNRRELKVSGMTLQGNSFHGSGTFLSLG